MTKPHQLNSMERCTTYWLSVDPGVRNPAFARWYKKELVWAGMVTKAEPFGFMDQLPAVTGIDEIVIEGQQIYAGTPNWKSMLDLAFAAGLVAGYYRHCKITRYLPRTWKGNVPKQVMVERIQTKITPGELGTIVLPRAASLHHNVWDAVGIGLYHAGRLK